LLSRFYPPNLLNQDRTRKEHSQCTEPRSNQLAEPRPTQPIEPNTNERDDDDNYLANPEPQNEHVGVDDDEDLYTYLLLKELGRKTYLLLKELARKGKRLRV